jgi:hypothetical protein
VHKEGQQQLQRTQVRTAPSPYREVGAHYVTDRTMRNRCKTQANTLKIGDGRQVKAQRRRQRNPQYRECDCTDALPVDPLVREPYHDPPGAGLLRAFSFRDALRQLSLHSQGQGKQRDDTADDETFLRSMVELTLEGACVSSSWKNRQRHFHPYPSVYGISLISMPSFSAIWRPGNSGISSPALCPVTQKQLDANNQSTQNRQTS